MFGFELDDEDLAAIAGLDRGERHGRPDPGLSLDRMVTKARPSGSS